MAVPDGANRSGLAEYLEQFRAGFRRRDQAQWASVYLHGLLLAGGRKSVETLSRRLASLVRRPAKDIAQALQNFISTSPWDEELLWWRQRSLLARRFAGSEAVLVIDDVVFPKQGIHSVGVQRQYSSALGRKINCQIAVGLFLVVREVSFLVALRLYLPGRWLRSADRLDAAGVPSQFRTHRTRAQLALELLDRARAAGLTWRRVVAGTAYGTARDFREGLAERGQEYLAEAGEDSSLYRSRADLEQQGLKDQLGLDHFEGRSWRGFHHHACLVALAQGFLWSRDAGQCAGAESRQANFGEPIVVNRI
jgi:SRSO17 transposase